MCTLYWIIGLFWGPGELVTIPVSEGWQGVFPVSPIVMLIIPRDVVLCVFISMMVKDVFLP